MYPRFRSKFLTRYCPPKLIWVLLIVSGFSAMVAFSALAWRTNMKVAAKPASTMMQPQGGPSARNQLFSQLALQPQADKLRRRLGQRFLAPGREVSVLTGTVNVGVDRYTLRLVRSRDDDEERLTIALNGGASTLNWSSTDDARVNNNSAVGVLRALAERLALDSPDQFILAQLRGASYFNVANNVRPSEAGGSDSYAGPFWDLVRIAEPTRLTQNRPQSLWRLYYLNSATGLIEKVVSQEQGQTITAELSGWVNQSGETIPTRTVWKLNNQTIMELTFTNITHNPKQ